MFEIDFEVFRYAFCVVIGGLFGFIFLFFSALMNRFDKLESDTHEFFTARDEYSDVRILSCQFSGLTAAVMILVFLFFTGRDGSAVNVFMHNSWIYLAGRGFAG